MGWRNKALPRAVSSIVVGSVVGAGLFQASWHLSIANEGRRYEAETRQLSAYAGELREPLVVTGELVGSETHGEYEFAVYQFPALDGSRRWLEVVVPPPEINAVAFLRHNPIRWSAEAEARLVVLPDSIQMNPALAPEEFFARHVRGEEAHSYGQHTVLVSFSARQSRVVYPPAANAQQWLWRDAVNEL